MRRTLFWFHLVLGIACSGVLLVVAATGVALALEQPVIAALESAERRVVPPADPAQPLPVSDWLEAAAVERPDTPVTGIRVYADKTYAAQLLFGKSAGLFVDPFTAEVAAPTAIGARDFFKLMLTWHRWLGVPAAAKDALKTDGPSWRDIAGTTVGLASCGLVLLAVSGLVIWFPHHLSRAAWKFATVPRLQKPGHVAYGNWHRVAGWWTLPGVLVVATTGAVMAFPVFGDALAARPDPASAARIEKFDTSAERATPDDLLDSLKQRFPAAAAYTLVLTPAKGAKGPTGVTATVDDAGPWPLATPVLLHPVTAEILRVDPPSAWSAGRLTRALARPLHTGLWGGPVGIAAALLTALATLALTLTGLLLTWRRFRHRRR